MPAAKRPARWRGSSVQSKTFRTGRAIPGSGADDHRASRGRVLPDDVRDASAGPASPSAWSRSKTDHGRRSEHLHELGSRRRFQRQTIAVLLLAPSAAGTATSPVAADDELSPTQLWPRRGFSGLAEVTATNRTDESDPAPASRDSSLRSNRAHSQTDEPPFGPLHQTADLPRPGVYSKRQTR